MGFEQVFDTITFKRMTALKRKIQFSVNYFLKYCFWIHADLTKF